MPDYPVSLSVLVQVLENGKFLAEALLFPEFSCLRSSGSRVKSDVRWLAEKVLKHLPAAQLHARHVPGQPLHGEIRLTIEPERGDKTWLAPVELRFDVIRWEHPQAEASLGFVPTLGIEVVAATAAEREARFEREIRAALVRSKALSSPRELVWLQRGRKFRVITVTCSAARPGAKQAAIAAEESRKPARSVLRQVATDLTAESLEPAYECDEQLRTLAELLTGHDPASVLLVGPSGVGKTALVDELVRRRRALGFSLRPFWRSSGARLVAGMSGFGMWEERCRAVCSEAAKTQAIMHLGNLVELMEVGKSTASTIGIAGFLRSAISRGELVAIVECTPEQVTFIERHAPSLLTVFHQVVVREPDTAANRRILEQTCAGYSFTLDLPPEPRRSRRRSKKRPHQQAATPAAGATGPVAPRTYPLRVLPEAFDVLDRLHRRYATYSASPGRQVRFMQNLLSDTAAAQLMARAGMPSDEPLSPVTAADVVAAFSRQTGLPKFLLDAEERLDVVAAGNWFTSRVLGQPDVASLVVDLLATVKAGLTRPNRPIASLLFIGPTGVGKTEMSKALATFLFGSPDRLTRFDMSEFGDAVSVMRLIGGVFGSEGVLTGKVREQPFSVLLFDEVEKGAPEFFDLLLQILGDGRLTDAGGRLADFRNAVVILTSNLGAESYQRGRVGFARSAPLKNDQLRNDAVKSDQLENDALKDVAAPHDAAREESARHFENAVRAFVRPELFNRIDRVVPFAPLDEETILGIARQQLQQLVERDGLKYRKVDLRLSDDVARGLARRGFDPRYGARPLKRRIERELLAPLADRINSYSADTPLEADIRPTAEALQIAVRATRSAGGLPAVAPPAFGAAAYDKSAAEAVVALRRQHQRLEACPTVVELETDLFRLDEWERRLFRDAAKQNGDKLWKRPDITACLARLAKLRDLAAEIRGTGAAIVELEQACLCRLYGAADEAASDAAERRDPPGGLPPGRPQRGLALDFESVLGKWESLLLKLYIRRFPQPDAVTIAVFSEDSGTLRVLANAYLALSRSLRLEVELHRITNVKVSPTDVAILRDKHTPPEIWRRLVDQPDEFLAADQPAVVGVGLAMRGPGVLPRFQAEAGIHEFSDPIRPRLCLVETAAGGIASYLPPVGIQRRGAIGGTEIRRRYDRSVPVIVDTSLGAKLEWFNRELADVLADAIERRLMRDAYRLLETEVAHAD